MTSRAAGSLLRESSKHNDQDMASGISLLAFRRPVADLTELRLTDPTQEWGLTHTQGPIAEDTVFGELRCINDLIICLDNLGVPGLLTVHTQPSGSSLKFLGEGGQFIVHEGILLDPTTLCETETKTEEVAIKTPKFMYYQMDS